MTTKADIEIIETPVMKDVWLLTASIFVHGDENAKNDMIAKLKEIQDEETS